MAVRMCSMYAIRPGVVGMENRCSAAEGEESEKKKARSERRGQVRSRMGECMAFKIRSLRVERLSGGLVISRFHSSSKVL